MKTEGTTTKHGVRNRDESRRTGKSIVFFVASYLFGGTSLLLWVTFLSRGALGIVDLGLGSAGTLFFDATLSLTFFVQHSVMVRAPFKRWMGRWIRQEYQGAVYTIASGVVLSGLVLLWQGPVQRLMVFGSVLHFVTEGMSFLALIGFIWGVRSLGGFDMFGSGSIIRLLRGQGPSQPTSLTIRGAYRWVRHPLYFCCLMAIWSVTEITVDRLLYNLMWTGWIIVGAMLEERDLVTVFGTAYDAYRVKVPMLVPWRRPTQPTSSPSFAGSSAASRA